MVQREIRKTWSDDGFLQWSDKKKDKKSNFFMAINKFKYKIKSSSSQSRAQEWSFIFFKRKKPINISCRLNGVGIFP